MKDWGSIPGDCEDRGGQSSTLSSAGGFAAGIPTEFLPSLQGTGDKARSCCCHWSQSGFLALGIHWGMQKIRGEGGKSSLGTEMGRAAVGSGMGVLIPMAPGQNAQEWESH